MAKFILFFIFLLIGSAISASEKDGALRLIYVFSEKCVFCKAWEREVGSIYGDTEYGEKAPLFEINISLFSTHFADVKPKISGTPTFILMNGNHEVGRIVGYKNHNMFFWALSEYIPINVN